MRYTKFLWTHKNTRSQLILTAVFALVFGKWLYQSFSQSRTFAEIWLWMDPFLTISTAIFAFYIWHNEKKQDWENSLPKKLDVYFRLDSNGGEPVYEVRNAPLAGAADIRQWGQQIGRQMNQADLAFHGFNVTGPERCRDHSGIDFMRYRLTIWLQTHDEKKPRKVWEYSDDGKLVLDGTSIEQGSQGGRLIS